MSRETRLWKSRLQPLSSSQFFIVDRIIDRKYSRIRHGNFMIPMYITLLHLCLGLCVNAEVLRGRENHETSIESLAVPPVESLKSKPSPSLGYGNEPLSLIRRRSAPAGPAQSALLAKALNTDKSNNGTTDIPTNATMKSSVTEDKISGTDDDKLKNYNVSLVDKATNVQVSTGNVNGDAVDDEQGLSPGGINPDAALRLFYVCVVIGVIVLIYILIKFLRFRRKRSTRKYRVLAHSDEQEMFPLAADDGDDEEIFNAADHQTLK